MPRATAAAPRLTWEQALAWRMARHHLGERAAPDDLLAVVAGVCGLHAQLMSSADLSLWARLRGLRPGTLDALLRDRALVKVWAMRGTLHLLPAREFGLWLAALGTHTGYGNRGHPEIEALAAALDQELRGRVLTREELAQAVRERTGSDALAGYVRFSWGSYLKAPSFRGLICFAPGEGNAARFTHPATWVPQVLERPEPEAALREVTRRYLRAYAPATAADLALWWGGYGPARGRRMLAALGDEVTEIDVEGELAWALTADVPAMMAAVVPETARLLPAFDPWVAGASRACPAQLDAAHKARVFRPQGWISPVVLVNGRMAGVWRHARKAQRLLVEVEPFAPLPDWARRQVESEAERLAAYMDAPLRLAWMD